MECKRIQTHLDAYLASTLPSFLHLEVSLHIEECVACRKEADWLRQLNDELNRQSFIPAPNDFTSQIMQRITASSIPPISSPPRVLWREWGLSFIAAGLLLFLFNSSPLAPGFQNFTPDFRSWSVENFNKQLTNKLYDFTDFITWPVSSLQNLYQKGGVHHAL